MSEAQTENAPETTSISKCDACIAAMEGVCAGLIVGGIIVAAPEELTIVAVVTALAGLGLAFGADTVREWITAAAKEGIKDVVALSKYICKKAGVCS